MARLARQAGHPVPNLHWPVLGLAKSHASFLPRNGYVVGEVGHQTASPSPLSPKSWGIRAMGKEHVDTKINLAPDLPKNRSRLRHQGSGRPPPGTTSGSK